MSAHNRVSNYYIGYQRNGCRLVHQVQTTRVKQAQGLRDHVASRHAELGVSYLHCVLREVRVGFFGMGGALRELAVRFEDPLVA